MAVSCCLLLLLAVVCAQQPSPRLDPSALRSGSSVSDLLGAQTRDFGTLEPSYVSGSVVMPRGKGIYCSRLADIIPAENTRVTFTISASGFGLQFSPHLVVDVQWPIADVSISQIDYPFGGKVRIRTANRQWFALPVLSRSKVEEAIEEMVSTIVKGTPVAQRSYNPWRDRDVAKTLNKLQMNMPPSANLCARNNLGLNDLINSRASAGFSSQRGYSNDGVVIEAGGNMYMSIELQGRLADHMAGRSIRIEQASVSFSPSMSLKKLAVVEKVRYMRGGRIDVSYASILDGLRAVAQLVTDGRINRNSRAIGTDLVHKKVDEIFKAWLRDNYAMFPGYDLRQVLGTR